MYRVGFNGFGALDDSQIARMDAIVAKAEATAVRGQQLVEAANGTWAYLIGAGSGYEALKSDAAASMNLYRRLRDERNRLASDPYASENDVLKMEGARPALTNTQAEAGAKLLTVGAAVEETLPKPGDLPWWVWALGGLAALAVLSPYVNRRKS